MNTIIVFALLVVVSLVGYASCETSYAQAITDANLKNVILNKHNQYRAAVKIPTKMTWDDGLANKLQSYYAKKVGSAKNGLDHSGLPNQGENIYASTSPAWSFDGAHAVDDWASEKGHYKYDKFAVKTGSNEEWCNQKSPTSCGHYTQIVWEKTVKVGCIKALAAKSEFKYYMICAYSPSGNVNAAGCEPKKKATCYYPYVKR
jgi:pathogenesis-related protein 1